MKQINLILKTDKASIEYKIDAEKMSYTSGTFNPSGVQTSAEEVGEILDTQMMALRLYWIIKAALDEGRASNILNSDVAEKDAGLIGGENEGE